MYEQTNLIKHSMVRIYILLVITLLLYGCYSPKPPVLSEVDLFDYVDSIHLSPEQYNPPQISACFNEGDKKAIPYFKYEIYTEYIGKGTGCLFALPKHGYSVWRVQSKDRLHEDIAEENRRKQANDLLFAQRDTLIKYFEEYIFSVRQEELEVKGGYEDMNGRIIPDYYPIETATVYTYLYEDGAWVEKAKDLIKDHGPRTYGEIVTKEILLRRFFNGKE
jgi:hypothetical protein